LLLPTWTADTGTDMQILFVHQNFPGQYRYLARHFADLPDCKTFAIGERANVSRQLGLIPQSGLSLLGYDMPPEGPADAELPGRDFNNQLRRAEVVASLALRQQAQGLDPDVICCHPGWGDSLYLKEVFPRAKLLNYFEYFFHPYGPMTDFDPEFPTTLASRFQFRAKNALGLLALDQADAVITPTQWQASTLPAEYRDKLRVIHDGIDTAQVKRREGATLTLKKPDGTETRLTAADEILSFSVRNLEPLRGFHTFMRALPQLQKLRPAAITLIGGGNSVSYGGSHSSGKSWKEVLMDEVGQELDLSRVFFLGKLPYETLLKLFSITSLHLYLTSPFVLSWSVLEAMACQAPLLASATGPVQEVLQDGENGFLVPFSDPAAVAVRAAELLAQPQLRSQAGLQARDTIVQRYDLVSHCLPSQIALVQELLGRPAPG